MLSNHSTSCPGLSRSVRLQQKRRHQYPDGHEKHDTGQQVLTPDLRSMHWRMDRRVVEVQATLSNSLRKVQDPPGCLIQPDMGPECPEIRVSVRYIPEWSRTKEKYFRRS